MKLLRRISISLGIIFFAICCGVVLLFNWAALGWKALSVQTGSMRPSIPQGSLVLMHSVPNSGLKVGDVITYANRQNIHTTTTHRIIKTHMINGKIPAYITKGDANPAPDPPVTSGLVRGKIVWHVPYAGKLFDFAKTPIGLLAIVYIPALLLIIGEIRRLSEYFRKVRTYKSWQILLRESGKPTPNLTHATSLAALLVAASLFIALPVKALLQSNVVTITNNRITVAAISPNQCPGNTNNTNINISGGGSGNNNNSVSVNNQNNQSASTGDATVSGNTNGGNATSGNAGNSNCTNINVNITNGP